MRVIWRRQVACRAKGVQKIFVVMVSLMLICIWFGINRMYLLIQSWLKSLDASFWEYRTMMLCAVSLKV